MTKVNIYDVFKSPQYGHVVGVVLKEGHLEVGQTMEVRVSPKNFFRAIIDVIIDADKKSIEHAIILPGQTDKRLGLVIRPIHNTNAGWKPTKRHQLIF